MFRPQARTTIHVVSLRLPPLVACGALALVAAGCGSSSRPAVVRAATFPWPGGPGAAVAATKEIRGIDVPLEQIEDAIPEKLPENPPQTCTFGARVEVTVQDHRTFSYGPCDRPAAIERLRVALIRAAAREHRPSSGRGPVSARARKSVINDWYTGTMVHWHGCAAVREAIDHLPTVPPMDSTVLDDLRAYEQAVCWP